MANFIAADTSAISGLLQLRASSIPRFVRCPASEFLPQVKTTSDAARLGTVVHLACENIVQGEATDLEALALRHGVSLSDLKPLFFGAKSLWEEYGRFFPDPQTEVEFFHDGLKASLGDGTKENPWVNESVHLTGHADIVSIPGDNTIRIADWKSGRVDSDYSAQLKTYALLALMDASIKEVEAIEKVYVAVFWLRERQVDGQWFDAAELFEWFAELGRAVQRGIEGELVVGSHCTHCPVANCPAFSKRAWSILPVNAPLEVTSENALMVYETLKAFKKKADDALELVEQLVRQNGPIETPEGRELTLRETTRESIAVDTNTALYLTSLVGEDALFDICSISKTKLLDAVTADAPRGTKKQVIDETMQELRKRGAVEVSTSQTLAIVKKEAL